MAFLNMEQKTWAFTFGILGSVLQIDTNSRGSTLYTADAAFIRALFLHCYVSLSHLGSYLPTP
jgi:hypothetical protein